MDLHPEADLQESAPERRFMGRLAGGVEEPHLKDYLHVLLMRRWVIIGVSFLVIFATALAVFLMTPVYKATCLLLIEPTKINVTDFQEVYDPALSQFAGSEPARREFMETQFTLLTCRPIMERVFAKYNFGEKEEFRNADDPIPVFTDHFSVNPVRRTRLVEVSFEWKDPELAAEVVDYQVNTYIQDYRERRLGVTGGGLEALKVKADELRPKVAEAADALQKFITEHGAVSLDQSQNIVVERLKMLNTQLTDLQNKRIELQSQIQSIGHALESRTPLEDLPEVMDNPIMRDLKMEWIRTQQEISDLSERFGQNHPELMAARAKLDAVRDKIEIEVRSILSATHLDYQRSKEQEENILEALKEQTNEVMSLDNLRIEYQILKDAHDTLNNTYRAIIQRIEEIEISTAAGSEEDNIFIIAPAKVPVKIARPKRKQAVLLAVLFGPMLGIALAFFLQYLDTTVKTREEVEQLTGIPVLGFVPALREELNGGGSEAGNERAAYDMLAIERPRSALAEAFRSLRTALSFSAGAQDVRSFLVTSPSPLEGKSLVSINLAFTFAQAGMKVLLVDSDMRKPRLHKTFDLPPSVGLSNLLAGEGVGGLNEAVHATRVENLFVLPSGPRPPNPAELLATKRMKALVREMEENFDRIIFDTPPVVNVTDSSILMHFVGGGLIVIRSFTTQRGLAQRASELLQGTQGRLLGIILNNADIPKGVYGYEGYYYYSSYYYYYGDSDEQKKSKGKKRFRRNKTEANKDARTTSRWTFWVPWSKKKDGSLEKQEADHPESQQPPV